MKDLTIPEKISLEKEIFNIRKKDVKKFIALVLPGAAIGVTVWLTTGAPVVQFFAMLATMGYLFLCYVVTARVEGNPSILNYLESLIRFRREQQRFYYKQGKEKLFHVTAEGSPKNISAGIH